MYNRFRNYCENHKILFTICSGLIYFIIGHWLQRGLVYVFADAGYWVFWVIFLVTFYLLMRFIKWFARIKYGD